jgi:hypothetical protein
VEKDGLGFFACAFLSPTHCDLSNMLEISIWEQRDFRV